MTSAVPKPNYRPWRLFAAVIFFVAVLSSIAIRLAEHWPDETRASAERWALASYRDATYFPIRAVIDGVNPYDSRRDGDPAKYMQRYPTADHFPLYSPLMLIMFAPLALLPVGPSMLLFAVLNAAAFAGLAWVALRWSSHRTGPVMVFITAAFLLAGQPGRAVFNSGQVAVLLTFAVWAVLQYGASRPSVAIIAVVVTTLKPTYGGPLGLLLLCGPLRRVGWWGLVLGGVIAVVGMAAIFMRGGDDTWELAQAVLVGNQSHFDNDPEVVTTSNLARIDTFAACEYLLGKPLPKALGHIITAVILGLTAAVIYRAGRYGLPRSVDERTAAAIMLAMTLCIYHNIYDGLLWWIVLLSLLNFSSRIWGKSPAVRYFLAALLIWPHVNILWTSVFHRALNGIGWIADPTLTATPLMRYAAASNGLALTVAWLMILNIVRRHTAMASAAEPAKTPSAVG